MTMTDLFTRIRSDRRVLVGVGAVVAVAIGVSIVVASGGDDGPTATLCGLASTDSGALLADSEADVAVIASRLRERADLIDSARSKQETEVSDALSTVSDSLRRLADATEAGDGGAQLKDLTAALADDSTLLDAQSVIDDAIAVQCDAPNTTVASGS